ncbi:hypothetical protein H5392_00565 [Tessaracoccus sp. MC1865]|uniref:hypothetical protein n=1 Tax=Tessaracoccus sp. MC1865 TaxID=2760310 RepID=UPI00160168DE|nr:hypothetical protein [Tessaracoccus sp. MC1865]MBB1482351.1 hypothetical protein [Tessaracoccus sp. MC1865]QTO38181.1 hypothetical protein J7D54_03515 [Tessaracoccus sp. MC1865]
MTAHKRRLRLSCECGRNLAVVSWDDVARRFTLDAVSGATVETYWPGRGARLVVGPSRSSLVARRNAPSDASLPVADDAPGPDAVTYTLRCRCGRVVGVKGERVAAWWHKANDDWETNHDAAAWRRLVQS